MAGKYKEKGVFVGDKSNIVLIGMPGSGKTTIGSTLSNLLKLGFLDCDDYLEEKERMSLQQLIDENGDKGFKEIEERRILELKLKNHVIAPGGSVVYSEAAMSHLRHSSFVIFLNVPYANIKNRLDNLHIRGIVGIKAKSLREIFNERSTLYKKYADLMIDCSAKSKHMIVEEIFQKLKRIKK